MESDQDILGSNPTFAKKSFVHFIWLDEYVWKNLNDIWDVYKFLDYSTGTNLKIIPGKMIPITMYAQHLTIQAFVINVMFIMEDKKRISSEIILSNWFLKCLMFH